MKFNQSRIYLIIIVVSFIIGCITAWIFTRNGAVVHTEFTVCIQSDRYTTCFE